MASSRGRVYIIGAGPGDVELLTVKAVRCLGEADVILHDALVGVGVIEKYAHRQARIIDVGKRKGYGRPQSETIDLLVQEARKGHIVARLKGGDPFVFGRGSEEARALAQAGIPFEIVPGMSSVTAVPAYAGIPLTHRDLASSWGAYTVHRAGGAHLREEEWRRIARGPDTLVFLMGGTRVDEVSRELVKHGRAPDTLAALISKGTTPAQSTVTGTLETIGERTKKQRIETPALLVVGEVVGLRSEIGWFEKLPLFGRKVLITRPAEYWRDTADRIASLGGQPISCPLLKVHPRNCKDLQEQLFPGLGDYDWVVFSSRTGVRIFFHCLENARLDARALGRARVAAIGSETAAALREQRLYPDLVPERYDSEILAEELVAQGIRDDRILLARSGQGRAVLRDRLQAAGARVEEYVLYDLLPVSEVDPEAWSLLEGGEMDYVLLTSSLIAETFARVFADLLSVINRKSKVMAIGPITAESAREHGLKIWREAREFTVEGILKLMVEESK